jgi:glycosyltransferase involved in cell wall biosynthesis
MRFSLIMATVGRTVEVREFIGALQKQIFTDFELIVVDQNGDDRLVDLCREFSTSFPVHHYRSPVRRNAHARNLGIAYAQGEIVAFPDDDCVYPPDLLQSVDEAFRREPRLNILTGASVCPTGERSSGRWFTTAGPISQANVWTSVIEFNLFVQAGLLRALRGFDENLGLGSPFGSCEGPDLVLRGMAGGARAVFDPSKKAIHPEKVLTPVAVARAFDYGAGMGYVMRKHRVKPSVYLTYFIRPFGGFLLNVAKLKPSAARYYWNSLRGRLCGFYFPDALIDESFGFPDRNDAKFRIPDPRGS